MLLSKRRFYPGLWDALAANEASLHAYNVSEMG